MSKPLNVGLREASGFHLWEFIFKETVGVKICFGKEGNSKIKMLRKIPASYMVTAAFREV